MLTCVKPDWMLFQLKHFKSFFQMKRELDQLFDKIAEDTTKASTQEPADVSRCNRFFEY